MRKVHQFIGLDDITTRVSKPSAIRLKVWLKRNCNWEYNCVNHLCNSLWGPCLFSLRSLKTNRQPLSAIHTLSLISTMPKVNLPQAEFKVRRDYGLNGYGSLHKTPLVYTVHWQIAFVHRLLCWVKPIQAKHVWFWGSQKDIIVTMLITQPSAHFSSQREWESRICLARFIFGIQQVKSNLES